MDLWNLENYQDVTYSSYVPRPEKYPGYIVTIDWLHPDPRTGFPSHIKIQGVFVEKPKGWPYPQDSSSGFRDALQWLGEDAVGRAIGHFTGLPVVPGPNPTEMGDSTRFGAEWERRMREDQAIREFYEFLDNPAKR